MNKSEKQISKNEFEYLLGKYTNTFFDDSVACDLLLKCALPIVSYETYKHNYYPSFNVNFSLS